FFCLPKPSHGCETTRAPLLRAVSTVASPLPASTTMRSSQNAILSRHSPMLAASFSAMIMALSRCIEPSTPPAGIWSSEPRIFAQYQRAVSAPAELHAEALAEPVSPSSLAVAQHADRQGEVIFTR